MVTAIILINVERHKVNELAEQPAGIREISEVYSVSGNYDLIAIVRVENTDALAAIPVRADPPACGRASCSRGSWPTPGRCAP